jgi:DNA primase
VGMVNLVNKFIRDRIDQDKRQAQYAHTEDAVPNIPTEQAIAEANNTALDESQEWQLIRVLLSHGAQPAEGFANTAQLIYERIDPEMIESKEALLFFNTYFAYISVHQSIPDLHYFTQHPNQDIQVRSATLLQSKNEVSHNWMEIYGIGLLNGAENYMQDVESTLGYFELKKVKLLQADIRQELNKTKDEQETIALMQQFLSLKKTEHEILQRPGTVIVKSMSR